METEKTYLVELTSSEQKAINGGNPLLAFIAIMGAVIYIYNNREDIVEGFKEGYNSVRKTNN